MNFKNMLKYFYFEIMKRIIIYTNLLNYDENKNKIIYLI